MLSGELVGFGIQGNPYKLPKREWHVFDIYDIESGEYLEIGERLNVLCELNNLSELSRIQIAPILSTAYVFEIGNKTNQDLVDEILDMASGESVIGNAKPTREGLVFKSINNPDVSFKSIATE
jgi:hypothetical protein